VMPTVLRACGGTTDGGKPLDGCDVLDVLTGKSAADGSPASRDLYFFTGQTGLENEQIAVTTRDGWKLVVVGPDVRRAGGFGTPAHRVQLFHLADDPLEKTDLAENEPRRVKALGEKLVAFRKSEPMASMPPVNRKPPEFEPPPKWHNEPAVHTPNGAR